MIIQECSTLPGSWSHSVIFEPGDGGPTKGTRDWEMNPIIIWLQENLEISKDYFPSIPNGTIFFSAEALTLFLMRWSGNKRALNLDVNYKGAVYEDRAYFHAPYIPVMRNADKD